MALLLPAALLVSPGVLASSFGAEDPLGAARAAVADGHFDDAKVLLTPRAAEAPGLLGAALAGLGDQAAACALYLGDRGSARAPAAALRSARCLEATEPMAARAAWLEVGEGPLGLDALVVDEYAAFLARRALPLPEALRVFQVRVGLFDDARRAALGRALLVVAERDAPARAARALERLLIELPDTAAAKRAAQLPAAKARKPEDLAAALERAEQLALRHDSEAVVAALERQELDNSPAGCEARLLLGKAWRKLRKYRAAQAQLDLVAQRCDDVTKRKAAYLAARVAAVSNNVRAVELLEGFARDWPDDPLTDDVLLWLGEFLQRRGDAAGARRVFADQLARFPGGDMAHQARFALALLHAERGDDAGARALLEEAARTAQGSSPYLVDRALYWQARLQAAPRPGSLEITADARSRDAGLGALAALARSRPASYYGHLARLLIGELAGRASIAVPALPTLAAVRQQALAGVVTASEALDADRSFQLARALVEGGYDEEARIAIALVDSAKVAAQDRFAVALLLARLGAPGEGHALLRNGGLALLPGSPGSQNALAWSLSWPRAHWSAIEPAADEQRLPRALLFGLAREESAFDAEVISWAGAVGLCQLMPPTAREEARALKLPPPAIAALTEPSLNARLGAAHLARRMTGLGHPLMAIAAYNAGPGNVQKWLPARGQSMPLDWLVERIPVEETRNYVKKVTGSWVTYTALDGDLASLRFAVEIKR